MTSQKILISGASIAGPALARWLGRNGFEVTVVEKAPGIRPGGQAVDFKGRTHLGLITRMGIIDDIRAKQTSKSDWRVVDANDRVKAVIPGEFIGGDVEIARGDLAQILYEHSKNDAEYVFGDEITAMIETRMGIDVTFAHRAPERYDLVIGADGVHSAVRRLAFGPEDECVEKLGYYYAVASGHVPLDGLETSLPGGRAVAYGYNTPDHFTLVGSQKAPTLFVFRSDSADYDRHDTDSQKAFLAKAYAGGYWRVPAAVAAAQAAPDFYLDAIARTRLTAYTQGRVALVGDAGYANTLGGFGTGLALIGAYVLAGELIANRGDQAAAFARYETRMRKPTKIAHRGNAGPFMAPSSTGRIKLRNLNFANKFLRGAMIWVANRIATDDAIPAYSMR